MKKIKFQAIALCTVCMMGTVLFTACSKSSTTSTTTPTPTACTGTDVANNTWAVIHANGTTTTVALESFPRISNDPNDDQITIGFSGPTNSTDMINFTFKGETAPASGTYTLVDISGGDKTLTASNQVKSTGLGSGTSTLGGGLYSKSGTITVTNNSGTITIEGKGMNYQTASAGALCVSFKLTK